MVHSIQLTSLCCPFCFTGCLKVIGPPRCGNNPMIANASGIGIRHEGPAPNKKSPMARARLPSVTNWSGRLAIFQQNSPDQGSAFCQKHGHRTTFQLACGSMMEGPFRKSKLILKKIGDRKLASASPRKVESCSLNFLRRVRSYLEFCRAISTFAFDYCSVSY